MDPSGVPHDDLATLFHHGNGTCTRGENASELLFDHSLMAK
jgi:hypothetical protein